SAPPSRREGCTFACLLADGRSENGGGQVVASCTRAPKLGAQGFRVAAREPVRIPMQVFPRSTRRARAVVAGEQLQAFGRRALGKRAIWISRQQAIEVTHRAAHVAVALGEHGLVEEVVLESKVGRGCGGLGGGRRRNCG